MKRLRALSLPLAVALAVLIAAGCASPRTAPPPPPLVLISIDAFRWDYTALYREETPHLRSLARDGVVADGLVPVFPSNTFPNHYSIVTGLYPAKHGIINNRMFDAARGEFFHYNRPNSVRQSHWWGGEPIWATAIRQGGVSAAWFWPGSEAAIGGVRPTKWRHYDPALPFETKLEELVAWLSGIDRGKPAVAVFYFEEINNVGHKFGPRSPELAAAIRIVDRQLAALHARLRAAGIEPNLVIVSDHGMTPISPDRVVLLDDFVAPENVQVDFDGSVAGLHPRHGDVDALVRAFARAPHVQAYRAEDLPARFHLRNNPRIPPVWLIPDEGWEIYPRASFESWRDRMNKGDHGFDPAFRSMHGIFTGYGPSFRRGVKLPPTENVHVYNLLCAALGLSPAPNDGDHRLARAALVDSR